MARDWSDMDRWRAFCELWGAIGAIKRLAYGCDAVHVFDLCASVEIVTRLSESARHWEMRAESTARLFDDDTRETRRLPRMAVVR